MMNSSTLSTQTAQFTIISAKQKGTKIVVFREHGVLNLGASLVSSVTVEDFWFPNFYSFFLLTCPKRRKMSRAKPNFNWKNFFLSLQFLENHQRRNLTNLFSLRSTFCENWWLYLLNLTVVRKPFVQHRTWLAQLSCSFTIFCGKLKNKTPLTSFSDQ
jgi:hypothetical protein